MKIQQLKRVSKSVKDFAGNEWSNVDMEHFGHPTEWKTEFFVLKGVESRKVIGFVEMKLEAGVMFVRQLLVEKAQRGKGVGKSLMEKAEKIAKKHGAHKLFLNTGEGWAAVKFYESLGYKQSAKMPKHFFKHDFVEFEKFID